LDKNVGSVDLEELRRAREELNIERGIETDPNMYSNYNPNRTSESSDVVSNEDSDEKIEELYDNLENSSSESNNSYEEEKDDEVIADALQDSSSQAITAENEPQIEELAENIEEDNYQVSSSADTLTENVSDVTANLESSNSSDSDMIDKLDGQELLKMLLGDSYEELEDEDADFSDEPMKKESTFYDEDPNADDDIYSIKNANQVKSTEQYESVEAEIEAENALKQTKNESESTLNETNDNLEVSNETTENQKPENMVNLSQFEVNDENSDNGLSVNLPNVDENATQNKDFNVYDNFSAFEVHYDPSMDEVQEQVFEEPEHEDNSIDLIKNILYSDDSDYEQSEQSNSADVQEESAVENKIEEEPKSENFELEDNGAISEILNLNNEEQKTEDVSENNEELESQLVNNEETETQPVQETENSVVEETSAQSDNVSEESEENITEILSDFSKLKNLNEVTNEISNNDEENNESVESQDESNLEQETDVENENEIVQNQEEEIDENAEFDEDYADEEYHYKPVESNKKESPYIEIKDYGFINAISNSQFKDSDKLEFLLGKNEDDMQVFADLERGYNMAIFNYGENENSFTLINTIILSLMLKNNPDEFKMVICDSNDNSKYDIYKDSSYLLNEIAKDNNKILDTLISLNQELESRYKIIASLNASSIENYNDIAEREQFSKLPYVITFVLNYSRMSTLDNSYRINSLIQSLLKFGRLAGIYVILETYDNDLNDGLNYNLSSRISFKTDIEEDSIYSVGTAGAEMLADVNDILYSKIDANPVHLKVPNLTEKELKLIIQNIEN